ncbi:MAG: ROK family protein [Clostridia bacterium]|nr:ROK family protein [Clostridia bacterium]
MVIGIDLGGMSAKAAVLNGGVLEGKCSVATSKEDSPKKTAEKLAYLAKEAARKAGIDFDKISAIGIGSPGAVDSETGMVVSWTNFDWTGVELARLVSESIKKPVFVLNDANAAALGEAKYGAGKKYSDSILITLGTGVGGGIMIGGKLFEGYKSAGAEIGHAIIRQGGELCTCGRRGCFERYASASALIRSTKRAMEEHKESALWKFAKTLDEVNGRTAFLARAEGDETAQKVVSDYIAALGEGIVNLVNILRPQAIILGGGVSHEGENLLAPLREYVRPQIYAYDYAPVDILCAELGNDAGLYGAATFAEERK